MSSEKTPSEIPIQIPTTRIVQLTVEARTELSVDDLHIILSDHETVSNRLAEILVEIGVISAVGDVGMWAARVFEVAEPHRN